ncbi:hypothetical protein BpHYR1_024856 [Brachionus plicatilis]|uniref:Uncharacterized protein n=1 Tax=Brachionus plicatilis TaxID=10195 RepID=A0A3M7RD29_BRAPC|nr:hypothetical protein BpHYR1_024856 [Brachionus plicatilis]
MTLNASKKANAMRGFFNERMNAIHSCCFTRDLRNEDGIELEVSEIHNTFSICVKDSIFIEEASEPVLSLILTIILALDYFGKMDFQKIILADFTFGGLPRFLFGSTSHGITSSAFQSCIQIPKNEYLKNFYLRRDKSRATDYTLDWGWMIYNDQIEHINLQQRTKIFDRISDFKNNQNILNAHFRFIEEFEVFEISPFKLYVIYKEYVCFIF